MNTYFKMEILRTVRNGRYLSSAIAKTGTRNRVEAVLHAEQHGWL